MPDTEQEGRRGPFKAHPFVKFSGIIASISVAVAIPIYIAGGTYLASYYRQGFGLSTNELGFTVYSTMLAAPVAEVLGDGWRLALVALIVFGLALALGHRKVMKLIRAPGWTGIIIGVCVVGFLAVCSAAYYLGDKVADHHFGRDIVRERSQLPVISIALVPSGSDSQGRAPDRFDDLEYLLISNANGHYYIFRPISGGANGCPAVTLAGQEADTEIAIMVYAIPERQVSRARILQSVNVNLEGGSWSLDARAER